MLFDATFRRAQLLASERFRRLFPWVCRYMRRQARYVLKETGPARYSRLHVILRTTDSVMNVNAERGLECIGIASKTDVIRKGSGSVAVATSVFSRRYDTDRIKVSIVADRLSAAGQRLYKEMFVGVSVEFVESERGNAQTFRAQINLALKDSDDTLVAIFEDDYLTDPETFYSVFELFNSIPKLCGFTPHEHPDGIRNAQPTRIYRLRGRRYKLVQTTTCTFFAGVDLIRRWRRVLLHYDGYENLSINRVWKREICISPCGWTFSEHLHRTELSMEQTLIGISSESC